MQPAFIEQHPLGQQRHPGEQRPLGELFSELARETGTLVKQEVQLAKSEMVAKTRVAVGNAAWTAAGGVVAFAGALALIGALVLVLALVLPLWLSALIVGAVVAGIGASMALYGLNALKHLDPVPRHTVQTLKEDRQWVSEQLSR